MLFSFKSIIEKYYFDDVKKRIHRRIERERKRIFGY